MSFKPPQNVANQAEKGLLLRKKWGRGGTSVGIKRAWQLYKRENISQKTLKRMWSFFNRHYKNRNTPPEKGNGKIAWLLWGGDAGFRWVYKELEKQGYFE